MGCLDGRQRALKLPERTIRTTGIALYTTQGTPCFPLPLGGANGFNKQIFGADEQVSGTWGLLATLHFLDDQRSVK